jgi:hypothetical protein
VHTPAGSIWGWKDFPGMCEFSAANLGYGIGGSVVARRRRDFPGCVGGPTGWGEKAGGKILGVCCAVGLNLPGVGHFAILSAVGIRGGH